MCGSGRKIAGMETTRMRRQMAVRGQVEIAPSGFCAAVLGATVRGICVPQAAAGTPRQAGTTSAVSVLPGLLES